MKTKRKILVLDGGNQNALAIVRHLGTANEYHIDLVAYNKLSPALFSKFVNKKYVITSPKKYISSFYEDLISILKTETYFLVMPVGFSSFEVCMNHREEIEKYTKISLTNRNAFDIASSKQKTYALAEELGIPYPKTWKIYTESDIETVELTYPVVIKAPFEMGKNVVEYAHSKEEAIFSFKKMSRKYEFTAPNFPIVQEYITGEGYGFFAFYDQGECKRSFMHKRIRENPPSGGVSTCAESFCDEQLFNYGKKILDALHWNGVAMVEFKMDVKDGIYKLMEINPKFWGSLELAIVSGVDFPNLILKKAGGEPLEISQKFEQQRFQWLLNGELFHFFSRPFSLLGILKDILFSKKDFWWSDIVPNLVQVPLIFNYYYKKIFGK